MELDEHLSQQATLLPERTIPGFSELIPLEEFQCQRQRSSPSLRIKFE